MENCIERAILVGLYSEALSVEERSTEESLDELASLLETAGGICIGKVIQNRPSPDPHSYIGSGKVAELKKLLNDNECNLVVFDNELSPSQHRALSDELGVKVIDRSSLILDIFAQRAKTKEGRLQVELAQYKYLLPRLTGMWTHLVRQTASSSPIGTRGPGETQLETDRRHIRNRITKLTEEMENIRKNRSTQRRQRLKNGIPVVAIIGYTNAGKSTLLNKLTSADIPAENRLFDTLDTTTRRLQLNSTDEILISDTVGFISKLPHHLIEAFKATLEELQYADILLHVIDASNPEWKNQSEVVERLICQLGAETKPCIRVYNKCDLAPFEIINMDETSVRISSLTGEGLDSLLETIEKEIKRDKKCFILNIPYNKTDMLDSIYKNCEVKEIQYLENAIKIIVTVPTDYFYYIKDYIQDG